MECTAGFVGIRTRADLDFNRRTIGRVETVFVVRDRSSIINGSRVEIDWQEHQHEGDSDDYPDLADAGTFDSRAIKGVAGPSDCFLYLYLRYSQEEAYNVLLPLLLTRPPELGIELYATLLADKSTLWAQPDGLVGRVVRYTLRLSRPSETIAEQAHGSLAQK